MKNFLLWVAAIVLSVIFTPWLGQLYELILGHQIGGGFFFTVDHPEYFEGFFIGTAFFITLLLRLFGTGMKNYVVIISLAVLVTLDLVIGYWMGIIVTLITALIAIALAHLILLAYKKFSR